MEYKTANNNNKDAQLFVKQLLGRGATAVCFGTDQPELIVKMFYKPGHYSRELEIMEKVKESPFFSQLVGNNEIKQFIVMRPLGEQIAFDDEFSQEEAEQYFCCLEALVQYNIVHRGINLRHFLWHTTNGSKK